MALSLALDTISQSNDNTTLRLMDATGTYSVTNTGGWGSPNVALSTIDGVTNALTFSITITTSDGTETVYDDIDVYEYLGATPTTVDDILVYVTPDLLISDGEALGEATDELPDGWYVITYSIADVATGTIASTISTTCLVDGKVRNDIYDLLRVLPSSVYISMPNRIYTNNWNELTFPLYVLSLFEAMTAYVNVARKNEILSTLNLIERLTV